MQDVSERIARDMEQATHAVDELVSLSGDLENLIQNMQVC